MNKRTLKALQGSIRKWEKIVKGTGRDEGWKNCPLCKLFIDNECIGCPVAEKVGQKGCKGTPYDDWMEIRYLHPNDAPYSHEQIGAARDELSFLRSLLPSPEK